MKEYECSLCGYLYQPVKGDLLHHVPSCTSFADVLETWECPVCHAPKRFFREHHRKGGERDFQHLLLKKAS
ncbi:MAG TPA: rubredoxin [Candidatus Ozemobacteraceae bacterium]|nr:rubredoxin [Candidatus Ozemobacteraceae bacterium]HQG29905.1 rubredoxin [Candidatus Ozemobacteraceae bacterium]